MATQRRLGRTQTGHRPPCDLDPLEYNVASAWWGPPNEFFPSGWRAFLHGAAASDLGILTACGCPLCMEFYERAMSWRRPAPPAPPPEPEPPKVVDVGPVRDHVRRLLEGGMSRLELAERSGIDITTIGRLLRRDVRAVRTATADAVLAVSA